MLYSRLPLFATRVVAPNRRFFHPSTQKTYPQKSLKFDLSSSQNNYLDTSQLNDANLSPDDFVLYPHFFDAHEQAILLSASLAQLDSLLRSPEDKAARKEYRSALRQNRIRKTDLALVKPFETEEAYVFHDAHFDGVISKYRETTVSQWPHKVDESLESARFLQVLLRRIYDLFPSQDYHPAGEFRVPPNLLLHLLHLSSKGFISNHIDNINASGQVITGLSLGSPRIMELEKSDGSSKIVVRLDPGSVYIQKGAVRYHYLHCIPQMGAFGADVELGGRQRVSLMIRDRLDPESQQAMS